MILLGSTAARTGSRRSPWRPSTMRHRRALSWKTSQVPVQGVAWGGSSYYSPKVTEYPLSTLTVSVSRAEKSWTRLRVDARGGAFVHSGVRTLRATRARLPGAFLC